MSSFECLSCRERFEFEGTSTGKQLICPKCKRRELKSIDDELCDVYDIDPLYSDGEEFDSIGD